MGVKQGTVSQAQKQMELFTWGQQQKEHGTAWAHVV